MNKLMMARVVVRALYAMKELPAIDDRQVLVQMKAKKPVLEDRFRTAQKIIGACTYPSCKCVVSTSTSRPEPVCPRGLS